MLNSWTATGSLFLLMGIMGCCLCLGGGCLGSLRANCYGTADGPVRIGSLSGQRVSE